MRHFSSSRHLRVRVTIEILVTAAAQGGTPEQAQANAERDGKKLVQKYVEGLQSPPFCWVAPKPVNVLCPQYELVASIENK